MKRFFNATWCFAFILFCCIACAAIAPVYVSTTTKQPREFVDSVCNAHNTFLPEIETWNVQATDSLCAVHDIDTVFKHAYYINTTAPFIKRDGTVDIKKSYIIIANCYPYNDSVRVVIRIEPQWE